MDIRLFLSKIIMLTYWSRYIGMDSYDTLIKQSIESMKDEKNNEAFIGSGNTRKLLEYINKMLESTIPFNTDSLVDDLNILMENDPKLLKTITRALYRELDELAAKQMVSTLSHEVSSMRKDKEAVTLINAMAANIKFNRADIPNIMDYINEVWSEIEPLTTRGTEDDDPYIVNKVDFNEDEEVDTLVNELKLSASDSKIYKTGWQAFNRLSQGGLRSGETVTFAALSHNYKTGFTMSIFMQLLRHNLPAMSDEELLENKIPLIMRTSLEDSLTGNIHFMYQYFKAHEGVRVRLKDLEKIDPDETSAYIKSKIRVNGWRTKMLRADPSGWGYQDIMNQVLKEEAKGFVVKIYMLDYLTKLSTRGCSQTGGLGTDKRDLLRRIRNFMSARSILFITPLQIATEFQNLRKQGISDVQFVKEIHDKYPYADSKQLAQEIDLEVFLHKVYHKGKWYLSVGRGKHRLPSIIEKDEWKSFILPFRDSDTPLLEDVHCDDTSMTALPKMGEYNAPTTTAAGLDALDEILA